jgi:hypothetical protein
MVDDILSECYKHASVCLYVCTLTKVLVIRENCHTCSESLTTEIVVPVLNTYTHNYTIHFLEHSNNNVILIASQKRPKRENV